MLDNNSLIVLAFLKNHFETSDKPISLPEIIIEGLSYEDISKAIDYLNNNGYLNINNKYVGDPIESINL